MAEAAKSIHALIAGSVQQIYDGSALASEAGDTSAALSPSLGQISPVVGETAAASREQRRGIESRNQAVAPIEEVTQQNAALVEQAAAAQSLKKQRSALGQAVRAFRLDEEAHLARGGQPAAHEPHALDRLPRGMLGASCVAVDPQPAALCVRSAGLGRVDAPPQTALCARACARVRHASGEPGSPTRKAAGAS